MHTYIHTYIIHNNMSFGCMEVVWLQSQKDGSYNVYNLMYIFKFTNSISNAADGGHTAPPVWRPLE